MIAVSQVVRSKLAVNLPETSQIVKLAAQQ
jgi:hypothetical protein